MFRRMKQRSFEAGYAAGVEDGQRQLRLEAEESKRECRLHEMQSHVGQPVIQIPNEWDNPIIGFGVRVEVIGNSPGLIIHDLFEDKEFFCFSTPMGFSEQKLYALAKLDPFERWALHAIHAVDVHDVVKEKRGVALIGDEFVEKVKSSQFWNQWLAFKATLPE